MELHIGSEIKKVAKQLRIGTVELAAKIPMTRQNLDKIYRKRTIDTELLLLISKALNFDFFSLYSDRFQLAKGIESMLLTEVKPVHTELDRCKSELEAARQEIQSRERVQVMSQKYIALLEDKLETLTGQRMEGEVPNGD